MSLENSILITLEDGNSHRICDLAGGLGSSLNEVGDLLDAVAADGLDIERHGLESARWRNPKQVLRREAILDELDATASALLETLEVHYKLDSTNSQLARAHPTNRGRVCLAEMQTAGRGRRGRRWVSPPCTNLYLSIAWRYPPEVALEGLSLGAGLTVARALRDCTEVAVGVKWPNDLYVEQRKLGGVLIELTRLADGHQRMILGVGINVAMGAEPGIDQPWTTLTRLEPGAAQARNRYAAALLNALLPFLAEYPLDGPRRVQEHWKVFDICYARPVRVIAPDGEAIGTGAGIDAHFQFRLLQGERYRHFASGDVSLRLV